jgi:type IV pilus assembly protein PilM
VNRKSGTVFVDLGSKFIKVIYGEKRLGKTMIKEYSMMEVIDGIVEYGNIKDINIIAEYIKAFINDKKVNPKYISFVIQGQDIVIRNIEVPIMSIKNIKKHIQWEINQYISGDTDDYILDFEIVEKIENKHKKAYRIMCAMVPKNKIQKFVEIASLLDLSLMSIDISTNCTVRAVRNLISKEKESQCTAIIHIGNQNSEIIILHEGKLLIEKVIAFGTVDLSNEIMSMYKIDVDRANNYIFKKLSFENTKFNSIDNALSIFSKVIQYALRDKERKAVDGVYILGGGSQIYGLKALIANYLKTSNIEIDVKNEYKSLILPKGMDVKFYINALGLSLRKE